MVCIGVVLEGRPLFCVIGWITDGDPDAENVVDEAFVERELGVLADESVFMYSIEQVRIWWGWGSTHGGSRGLEPEGIPELEHVVSHDEGKCLHERLEWDGGESRASLMDILAYLVEGGGGADVGIHRDGVGGE